MSNEQNRKELPKLIRLIKKYFWKLVIFNTIVGIVALVILLLMPEWYRSTATVISEEQGNQLNVTSVALNNLGFSSGLFGQDPETLRYIRYLKSRTIADKVIDEFDLMTLWKKKYRTKVYEKLSEDVSFVDNEDGSISISVIFKEDPQMAADIANFFVAELLRMIKKFESNYEEYVGEVYRDQNNALKRIENKFGEFQKKTGIYNLESQSEFVFEALTELEIQRMQLEIQRDIYKNSSDENDPRIQKLNAQIKVIINKINDYRSTNKYSNIPVNKLSEQGIEYLRQYRDLMVQEKIVQFIAVEYEQAKLTNQKEEIKLNVIDYAVPADMKYKPKKASALILILLASGLLSLMAANFKETYF
ncbi:MAG: Wzz/FepE/Etk N-terminal domain-containing protein [Candidatus Marinimicrobia bacterium]|nr:Wzz/FepE/Etk N-terminal domain-containing protein [Candidatus Neomarinimicrobiota bacterium]